MYSNGTAARRLQSADALMLVERDGTIRCATPLAFRWLKDHFGPTTNHRRLPPDLRRWLAKPKRKGGQSRPFVHENPQGQLVVSQLYPEADNVYGLLLQKRSVGTSRPRLRHLGLTKRQTEVHALLRDGKTNAQIARTLGISQSTVKRHVEDIFVRLRVRNRTTAAAFEPDKLRRSVDSRNARFS